MRNWNLIGVATLKRGLQTGIKLTDRRMEIICSTWQERRREINTQPSFLLPSGLLVPPIYHQLKKGKGPINTVHKSQPPGTYIRGRMLCSSGERNKPKDYTNTQDQTRRNLDLPKQPQIYTVVKISANQTRKLNLNELPKKRKLWGYPGSSVGWATNSVLAGVVISGS